MDGLLKIVENMEERDEFSLKNYFFPLTTAKAITWIVVIGLIVYGNMLFNGFVWDDFTYIVHNSGISTAHNLNFFEYNIFNSRGNYTPIIAIYFFLLHGFGPSAFQYHLLQVVLHIGNAILVFLFFKNFFTNLYALLLSLIFLVHPVQAESVSFISASTYPVFFFFGMSAFLLSANTFIGWKRMLTVTLLLLLALLTKESAIVFLVLIPVYQMFFKKKYIGPFLTISLVVSVLYGVIRFGIANIPIQKIGYIPIQQLNFSQRLLEIPAILSHYLLILFYPAQLAIDQRWVIETITLSNFYLPLGISVLFLLAVVLIGKQLFMTRRRNGKAFLFFVGWFLIGLLPYLQLVRLDATVAERYLYFPIVGLLGLIGCLLQAKTLQGEKTTAIIMSLSITMIIALSLRTIVRNTNFYDNITLFSHDARVMDNYYLENNLGSELYQAAQYKDALIHMKRSVHLLPMETNMSNLAVQYAHAGDTKLASYYYSKAFDYPSAIINHNIHKHEEQTYINYAVFLFNTDPQKAEVFLEDQALKDWPYSKQLHTLLLYTKDKLKNK